MAEEEGKSLTEQYEIGEEPTTSVAAPVETSDVTTTETTPRGPDGRFVSQSTPATDFPSHSAALVRLAKQAGFEDEEIRGIPPEALQLAIARVNEVRQNERREASIERTHHEARQTPPPPATDVPPQRREVDDDFDVGLSPEEFDPGLIAALKKMGTRYDAELKVLKAEVAQLRNAEIFRQNETLTQKIDRLFSGQPEERFGKGPGRKLDKDSPEMQRRLAVLSVMERYGKGDVEEHFEKAVTALYGKTAPKAPAAEPELEARKEQWNRSGVARPTHRAGAPEPNGVAKAKASVSEIIRDMGGSDDTTTEEEFLG